MEQMLKPAGDAEFKKALLPLLLATVMPNMEGMDDQTQQAFFAAKSCEYSRLMSHFPVDIIREACDAHVMRSKFFPAIAELMEFAEPAFGHRQRQASRIDWLIKNGGRPKPVEFVPEPEEVRLRATIKRFFDNRGTFIEHVLKRSAITAEKRLAEIESRDVESWALDEKLIPTPTPKTEPATIIRTAEAQYEIDRTRKAREALARAGIPLRSSAPVEPPVEEEPPPPDDIPEGDDQ